MGVEINESFLMLLLSRCFISFFIIEKGMFACKQKVFFGSQIRQDYPLNLSI